MADRYWVGGSGTWDVATTTRWSATSGGAGGASVPTASDNVIIDSGSGSTGTITLSGSSKCLSLTVSKTGVTFAGTGALTVTGSMTLISGTTYSATGLLTFNSTTTGNTITTNSTSISAPVVFDGVGGYWTLGSALSTTNTLTLTTGTLNTSTNNYGLTATAGIFISNNSNTKSMLWNASTIVTSSFYNYSQMTNFTFTPGTSRLVFGQTYTGATIYNISTTNTLTFYNVDNSVNSPNLIETFSGALTFNNLSLSPGSSRITLNVFIYNNITVNGTFSIDSGNQPHKRTLITNPIKGTPVTITAAAVLLLDADFEDIVGAGAATWSGTRLGNCGGNSNITFPAAKTVYFSSTTGGNWSAGLWSNSSGGVPPVATLIPLPQDTVIIDNNSGSAGSTITIDGEYSIGTLNMSGRTNALTLQSTAYSSSNWYGGGSRFLENITFPSAVTLSGSGELCMAGRTAQSLTINGTATAPISVYSMSTVQIQNNITLTGSNGNIWLYYGTLNLNSKTVTANNFNLFSSANTSQTLAFGTATLILTGSGSGGSGVFKLSSGNGTFTSTGAGTVRFTSASTKQIDFKPGYDYNFTIDQGGAGALYLFNNYGGTPNIYNITNSYSATGATTITFYNGGNYNLSNFTASGAAGKILTLNTNNVVFQSNLICPSGLISVDYLSINNSNAYGGAAWYAGANSTGSTTKGWIFTAAVSRKAFIGML